MDVLLVGLSLGSAFFFALALVLTQFGLRTLEPMPGTRISVPTTTAFFLVLSPLTIDFSQWRADSAALFAVVGLFFPVSVTLLTFSANRLIGPNLTGALGNLTPIFAVTIAVLLLGEAPRTGQLAGVAAVCLGIILLFGARARAMPSAPSWALALPLGAALVRGLVQPVVKIGLQEWPNPFAAVTIGYLVSSVAIVGLAFMRTNERSAPTVGGGWRWFVPVGLSNGLAVLGLYAALARGPVTLVAPLVACYPIFTLILNRLLLGDRSLTAPIAAGIMITVAGIVLLLLS